MTDETLTIQTLREMREDIRDIKKILNGNGHVGLVAKVQAHEDFFLIERRRQWDLATILFRGLVGFLIGYIAFRVGLYP